MSMSRLCLNLYHCAGYACIYVNWNVMPTFVSRVTLFLRLCQVADYVEITLMESSWTGLYNKDIQFRGERVKPIKLMRDRQTDNHLWLAVTSRRHSARHARTGLHTHPAHHLPGALKPIPPVNITTAALHTPAHSAHLSCAPYPW